MQANPAGQSSLIAVNGSATLNGGTVVLQGAAGRYHVGETFTILTTTGSQSGAYSALIDEIPGTTAELVYDGVFIVLTSVATNFALQGQTFNQISVARTLDLLSLGPNSFTNTLVNLQALPTNQLLFALDQMSGEIHASVVSSALENQALYLQTLAQRLRLSRSCLCQPTADNLEAGCEWGVWHGWATPFGQAGTNQGNGNAHGFSYNSVAFAAGADCWLTPSTLCGFAAGYDNWSNSTDLLGSQAQVNALQSALYGYQQLERAWVLGIASYELDCYRTSRPIDFVSSLAQGSYTGQQLGGYLESGYSLTAGNAVVQPIGAVQAISLWREHFSETGAGLLDLNVQNAYADSLRGYLGGRLLYPLTDRAGRCWLPEVRGFWVHEYAADTRNIGNQFAGGGPDFLIYGSNLGRDWGLFGLGLSTQLTGWRGSACSTPTM